jgi:hypothetical protein
MRNPGFSAFLKASPRDRRDVFVSAAARLGTPEQNVEKDFWVTWTLDALFNDVHRIFESELGARAAADQALGADCVAHARMFFNSPDLGLDRAVHGTFSLQAADAMLGDLRRDYARMSGMIIGAPPEFDKVMASAAALESALNR